MSSGQRNILFFPFIRFKKVNPNFRYKFFPFEKAPVFNFDCL